MSGRRLLVTTSSEESWGTSEQIVFATEAVKLYERRHIWSTRDSRTVPFHWDDRDKLRRDYAYLESLNRSLVRSLAAALNEFHQVEQSVRYWKMLLEPWLASYLGTMFDRWECMRLAFEEYGHFDLVAAPQSNGCPPYGYHGFLDQAFSDEWNRSVYESIVRSEYSSKCAFLPGTPSEAKPAAPAAPAVRSPVGKLIWTAEGILGKWFDRYDVVFLGSTFSLAALIRLNMALGQVPRLFLNEFAAQAEMPPLPTAHAARAMLTQGIQPAGRFEQFLIQSIAADLPGCIVEHYRALQERARALPIRTKAIVTGGHHWWDEFAKVWFAEQVSHGVKLIIAEHGGSLPPFKEWFDFEVDIADAKATWFLPHHPKHTQVPPPKFIGRVKPGVSRLPKEHPQHCSIILLECPRWVHRAHLRPMASHWKASFEMVLDVYGKLDREIQQSFRVKPFPVDSGWNIHQRCADVLGSDKVTSEKSTNRVIASSRVVVCAYPETAFSEAMVSGVPSMLVYPRDLYDFNPIASGLLDTLLAARIVFHDSQSAAAHLNAVWAEPDLWWNSDEVCQAREAFRQQALNVQSNWLDVWKAFLIGVVRGETPLAGSQLPQAGTTA